MNEHDLKQVLRESRNPAARRTWRCADDAELAAFAEGRVAGRAHRRIEAHLAGCDYCLAQVACLMRLETAGSPPEAPGKLLARARELVGRKDRPRFKPTWQWGAVAAATACFALVTTFWVRHPQPEGSEPSTNVVRKAPSQGAAVPELLSPREGAVVARESLEIRWAGIPRSLFYEVRILTADGNLIWETRAGSAPLRVPNDVRLDSGQKYYVFVSAWLPEGKTAKSPAVGFQVADR